MPRKCAPAWHTFSGENVKLAAPLGMYLRQGFRLEILPCQMMLLLTWSVCDDVRWEFRVFLLRCISHHHHSILGAKRRGTDECKSNYSSEYLSTFYVLHYLNKITIRRKFLRHYMTTIICPRTTMYKNTRQGRERKNPTCTNGVGPFFDVLPRQFIQLLIYVFFVSMKFWESKSSMWNSFAMGRIFNLFSHCRFGKLINLEVSAINNYYSHRANYIRDQAFRFARSCRWRGIFVPCSRNVRVDQCKWNYHWPSLLPNGLSWPAICKKFTNGVLSMLNVYCFSDISIFTDVTAISRSIPEQSDWCRNWSRSIRNSFFSPWWLSIFGCWSTLAFASHLRLGRLEHWVF